MLNSLTDQLVTSPALELNKDRVYHLVSNVRAVLRVLEDATRCNHNITKEASDIAIYKAQVRKGPKRTIPR